MSYNITHSEYLSGKLFISRKDARSFSDDEDLPEVNFLHELNLNGPDDDLLEITPFRWSGSGSRDSQDLLLSILAKTKGRAHILFVWEDGDSQTGLCVDNGVVVVKKVKIVLED